MHEATIARNYAEALFALAAKAGDLDGWGATFSGLAGAVAHEPRLVNFLAAPQVSAADKNRVLAKALAGQVPALMLRFVQKLVLNRRQMLLSEVAIEYGNLVDEKTGRVHAQVTVAREATEADSASIAAQLSRALGKVVVPHIHVNPALIGGVVVKIGDTVMDGSVRRRLSTLRSRLILAR